MNKIESFIGYGLREFDGESIGGKMLDILGSQTGCPLFQKPSVRRRMKSKQFSVAILLGVVLCFASRVGYGEVAEWIHEARVSGMGFEFLQAKVDYMAVNPTSFLDVSFYYDLTGTQYDKVFPGLFPPSVDTERKVIVLIFDSRDRFSSKSGIILLDSFKKSLETIYLFISHIATSMNTDIVAKLYTREEIPLAYFYQGVYQLWEE